MIISVLLYDKGQDEKAQSYYNIAIGFDSEKAVYHANLGLVCRSLEKWDEMRDAYEKAVKLEPKNISYYEFLVNAYFELGKLVDFVDFFEKFDNLKDEPNKKAIIHN